jgi:hypothetical protein
MGEPNYENVINGAALLYASIRDVQISLSIGTAELELKRLIVICPQKSKVRIFEKLKEIDALKAKVLIEIIDARTSTPYSYNPGYKEVNRTGLREESIAVGQDFTCAALSVITDILYEDGYLYQEGRTVEKGGID